jgi:agmatinase
MKRYHPQDAMVFPRFAGIRTFMRLPHVTDLRDVDFAIVGVPFDTGATFRAGARFGPEGIRSGSMLLRPYNPALDIAVFDVCSGVDYGDLPVVPGYLPESHEKIQAGASAILEQAAVPIFLGGDHSISWPLLRAVTSMHGPVALVHFDAHSDLWQSHYGGKDTHGTPFRRSVEEGLIDVSRSCQIGLRGPLYDRQDAEISEQLGFQIIRGPELHLQNLQETVEQIRRRAGEGPAYLSFDIDCIDPAYAPGTGTPEVGGLTSAQCLQLIRGLSGIPFVAYDLVEVMPMYDPAGITSLLAANIVYEFISIIALQRRDRRPNDMDFG